MLLMHNTTSNKRYPALYGFALLILPVCGLAQEKPALNGSKSEVGAAQPAQTPRKPIGTVRRLASSPAAAPPASNKVTVGKGVEAASVLATVVVKANSEVSEGRFTLGQIADIQSKDKALSARLAAVEIGTVSLPGMSRLIGPGDITVHLRAGGLSDLLDHKRLDIVAPPEMRITRTAHDIAADEITRAAIESAQIVVKDIPNATLEAVNPGAKLTVGAGKARVIAGAYRGQPESGTITVPVSVQVDGKTVQAVDVALRIRRKMLVVVARRTLEPHDVVSVSDVMLSLVDLPAGFVRPLIDLQEAVGKRATRRIMGDMPVSFIWLETLPDMPPNTRVTIEYVFGSIHITAPGLSQQAGMIGDMIRVYAQDTHKELQAQIVDAHTVRLIENDEAE